MKLQNLAVVGVGGVGGYFGGKLCQLLQTDKSTHVSFIARGVHLQAIQEHGLQLDSVEHPDLVCRPSLATEDIGQLPPLDFCLVCVKVFDLAAVLSLLRPLISSNTVVLPLLNGMDIYARVRAEINTGIVLPACVYVGTHLERPGRVVQRGGACKILMGADPQRPEFNSENVLNLLRKAAIKAEYTTEIQAEIWKKFTFIAAYGIVAAAHDKSLGEIGQDSRLTMETLEVMEEVVALARALGVLLPLDIVPTSMNKARDFPHEAKTSFQRDFERADKKDERELYVGSILRLGSELGIEVPRTKSLGTILAARKPVWW